MTKQTTPAIYLNRRFSEEHGKYIDEEIEIYVGMPCTFTSGSDSYPAHVSRISDTGKTVWIKRANVDGVEEGHDYYGTQKYIITPSDSSEEEAVRKNKYHQWKRNKYSTVHFGYAIKYQDPTF